MNLHKTIGFLATLLLVFGLGVSDSFAQNTLNVSLSRDNYVREGSSIVVTVTVAPMVAEDASTVTVTVGLATTTGFVVSRVAPDPNDPAAQTATTSVDVEIDPGKTTGTATLYIVDDDIYIHEGTLTVTPPSGGVSPYIEVGDAEELPILDNDDATGGDLTLTVMPPSVSANGEAQTVTLKVALAAAPGTGNTVSVTAIASVGDDDDPDITVTIDIADDAKDNTGELVIPATNTGAAGTVEVTASANNYRSDSLSFPLIARNAQDVEGFRVTLVAPSDGAWVGFGSKKVKIDVTRLDNTQSYPWTAFESLAVSLRDTTNTGHAIITVTVANIANQNGNIVFTKTQAGAGTTVSAIAAQNVVTYNESEDKFRFEIQLVNAANDLAGVLGTLTGEDTTDGTVTDSTDDNNHPQAGLTAKGQRMGMYASAVFAVGTNTHLLNSNDDKKKVFSNPATPGADQSVGDGKLFKIDLLAPTNEASGINITLNDSEDSAVDAEAKIGDELKVAVPIASQQRFLRDGGMQIQILTIRNNDASRNAKNATLKTANFTQAQISAASGEELRTSLKLNAGTIRTQAFADGHTRDGVVIKKNSTKFEPDYVGLEVRVRTKDQAGNFSDVVAGTTKKALIADTRAPGIHVLYPAADGRITGDHADTNWDEFLNPLRIRLDEDVDSLYVYAEGNESAESVTADNFFDEFTISDTKKGLPAILLWNPDEDRDLDRSEIVGRMGTTSVGDTIIYNTERLLYKKSNNKLEVTGQGGTKINLVIVAVDLVGNRTKKTLNNVIIDEKVPTISDFFPRSNLLEEDDNQINDATRHPVFTLKEAVDSLSVTYDPSSGGDIVEVEADGLAKGEHQTIITDPFDAGKTYTLTIFARDLAGNAYETPANAAANLKFNENFDNPIANAFEVEYAKTDSVIAGQVNDITIQAYDNGGTAATSDDRDALTHKGAAMISAWDMASGGKSGSVRFHGGGVTDNGDGSAMLNAAAWKLGKRTVKVMSNKNIGLTKLRVQNLMDGEGGTTVLTFEGAVDSFYVGAADFVGFEITAWQDGNDVSDRGVTGDFDLLVVPVDRYGNSSVRAYPGPTGKLAEEDSLAILDTRIKTAIEYKNGIDVTFASIPALEELNPLFVFPIEKGGQVFQINLPERRRSLTVQARVDNDNLSTDPEDIRSQDIRTTKIFNVVAALEPVLTLWVPGYETDQAGNDVVIPADPGDITVTVAAAGYNAGSMVTFTKDGTAMDPVAADDNGVARLMIMMSAAGSVTVSATDGDWPSDELTITFVEGPDEPVRMAYVDDMGMPVYLITSENMMVDVPDFLAFVAAYGSSSDADNYNIQADIDDDGDVDIDDFLAFISSYDRTAVGPATKPIVLLPGINENAEFSLNLGSERVVAGELVAVDVSLANVAALMGYGFVLNYEMDKFEFISVAPADEDLLTSTGGETLFHHVVADGQVSVATGMYNGTAVSGGGDIVRFVFRVLREFEDNARFEIANGLVFDPSQLQNPAVVAGVLELQSTPREFALHQNFPNPFNPDTTIKYDLAESADVTLQIYNVLGQVVRTLVVSEAQNAGRYQIRWNGMDDRGVPVSSGIYFYQISADGKFSDVRKLMLLK